MLYFRALHARPRAAARGATPRARSASTREPASDGWPALHAELRARRSGGGGPDPAHRCAAHPARARGATRSPGEPISDLQHGRARAGCRCNSRAFALVPLDRAALYARIEQRFDAMLAPGCVDEVRGAACARRPAPRTARHARGRLSAALGAPRRCMPLEDGVAAPAARNAPTGQAPADLAAGGCPTSGGSIPMKREALYRCPRRP